MDNFRLTPDLLMQAMNGENHGIAYYTALAELAPDDHAKDMILHFRDDEEKHLNAFEMLFTRMTGRRPNLPAPEKPEISSFEEGLGQAFSDEMGAYELYRNIILANPTPFVREIFFEAMTDENEHAIKNNYLYRR